MRMTTFDYAEALKAVEFHWLFIQGEKAIDGGLYVPGSISLLTGIEASIRSTLHQLKGGTLDDELGATLSNSLLRKAKAAGLPVGVLAFPTENDFESKLTKNSPYTELVRLRHNFAHGNMFEYVNRKLGFFTPECLRPVLDPLLSRSRTWATDLGAFRARALPPNNGMEPTA